MTYGCGICAVLRRGCSQRIDRGVRVDPGTGSGGTEALGADYFLRANADNLRKYHVKRLQQLGYEVQLTGPAAA